MGTITAQSLIAKVQTTLLDPSLLPGAVQTGAADGEFWANAELFAWLNEAMEQIAAARYDAYVQTFPVSQIAGVEQYIDPDAVVLRDLLYNMGQFGDLVGATIRIIDMDEMKRISPSWTTDEPSMTTLHYMYSIKDPRRYYTWPPVPPQGNFVQASMAMIPPTLTSITQLIPLEDTWSAAIYDYMLMRSYEKNTKRKDMTKYQGYMAAFKDELGTEAASRTTIAASPEEG